ncbi:CotO family spore coat protein [Metabacillus sp. FJAT-53654]|uniref:CotO family spore coat protein n=1 Tax=Metabacillus rhizosphaerae TaxID=3117747 RepID=A0ABZ2MT31_9BACI
MSNKQKQKYRMQPLMYIVQPDNQDINVNMQSFVVKKAKPKSKPRVDSVDTKAKTLVKEAIPEENEILEIPEEISSTVQENPVQENPVEKEQSAKQYRKQRKPITQMSIEEKIEFFTNLPKNMPRTLCQIESTEEKYRGVIISEVNGIVTIRSLTHAKPIELPLENIKAINLLGF